MQHKKKVIFVLLALLTFFKPLDVFANDICQFSISKKNVVIKKCNDQKIIKKSLKVLKNQIQHALLLNSDFEAIVKRDNPIYRIKDPGYRLNIQNIQWNRSSLLLERLNQFNQGLASSSSKKLDLSKDIAKLKKELSSRSDFYSWQKNYNIVALKSIRFFLSHSSTLSQEAIAKNSILRDILATKYWNSNQDWQIEWVKIPTGKMVLGANKNQPGYFKDETEFEYNSKKIFHLSKSPVTQLQWVQIMGSNPSMFNKQSHCPKEYKLFGNVEMCPSHPVENVSVNDVYEYLEILQKIDPQNKLRLPSVQEWEYAARGMSKHLFWFSSKFEEVGKYCWEQDISNRQTQPVASKPLNPFGLSDTCGNVWQITGNKNKFFLKGGSWTGGPRILRPATTRGIESHKRFSNVGVRLCK